MDTGQGWQVLLERLRASRNVEPITPKSLRVYREEVPAPPDCDLATLPGWRQLCRSFLETTGCLLRFLPGPQPSSPDDIPVCPPLGDVSSPAAKGSPFGHLRLDPTAKAPRDVTSDHPIYKMARGMADVLGELLATRIALWQREAELAAGIPVIPHPEEDQHLAQRLDEILHSAVRAVEAHAAAVYILDETTSHLKLRAVWGLPKTRLLAPPRILKTAMADLEAMLGHAVIVDRSQPGDRWNPPETYPTAVCLPISTPTTILGTLWIFCDHERTFSDRDIDLLEVTAGRVAAELEREAALQTALQTIQLQRQVESAQRLIRSQLPTVSPLMEGWELAGWMNTERMAGAFFDWCCPKDGRIHFALGEASDDSVATALTLSAVRAAWRAHAQYQREVKRLVEQLNLTLWTGSAGDQSATMICGTVDPKTGMLRLVAAGTAHAVLITEKQHRVVSPGGAALGIDPESTYLPTRWKFPENAILVAVTIGFREAIGVDQRPLWETQILPLITSNLHLPAKTLVQKIQQSLEQNGLPSKKTPAVLVVKRRPGKPVTD